MNRLGKNLVVGVWEFLARGIWEINTKELSRTRAAAVKALRVPVLALHDFKRDNCWMRASALTYYSLLGIVPMLAMVMGIARGFGVEAVIEGELLKGFEAQQQAFTLVLTFAKSMLANTKGGAVTGIWLLLLLWTVIKMFSNIEEAFNQIWYFKRGRPFGRMVLDYLAAALLVPVLWLPASGLNVLITHQLSALTRFPLLGTFNDIIVLALSFLPWVMIWVLLSFMYIFLPNGNIRWSSGILAGVVAGTAFQLFQIIYINFQIGVARNNAIFGSFAALPLFLIWLYFSWGIILLGAEVAFAHQNSEDNSFGPWAEGASFHLKKKAALLIMRRVGEIMEKGAEPENEVQLAKALDLPRGLVQEVLFMLVTAKLLAETMPAKWNGRPGFLPVRDMCGITLQDVLERMEKLGVNALPQEDPGACGPVCDALAALEKAVRDSEANKPVKEIR